MENKEKIKALIMETKEMKALNCLLSVIDCYMKEDEKYGIFSEDTIKKDVKEAKTILETFIKKEYKKRAQQPVVIGGRKWKD